MTTFDGMRGIAAILVLLHHAGPATMGQNLLPRGYLAVDFFFMLSGFVMTLAYEERFRSGMSIGPFLSARVRRLYPTIAIGITCGALIALCDGFPLGFVLPLLAAELLFLPRLNGLSPGIFRFDGAQWSLLFELLANVLHERIFHRMGIIGLIALAAIALSLLGAVAFHAGSVAVGP